MNTVRYVVCGALSGYGLVGYGLIWLPVGDVIFTPILAAGVVGGCYYGYRHAKKKQARDNRVVHDLPERTQDGAHAAAA